ncbi:MAG TPA: Holliday junction resolvase RuvX [bacterium]|nr:Holliday junction resolvase RuvX [bacterium]
MRILAIDYGERRTGIAVSDKMGMTAQGLDTIEVKDESEIPDIVVQNAKDTGAETIVIGLPLNMDGTESEKSRKVREFGAVLAEKTSLPVVFWDERMTSMQAKRVMQELNKKTYRNKQLIDKISATLILQEYLKTI